MRGGTTDIGEHAQPARAVAEYVLGRFARIVRHRKGLYIQVANRERFVVVDHPDLGHVGEQSLETSERSRGQPYGNAVAASEPGYAADVIIVLMGHDNGAEIFGNKPKASETVYGSGKAKAAIEQQPGAACLDHK
jgi:hypothetical protein